jgi:hypothetical protein
MMLAGVALVASAQMSGCCGGSPTHGCKFVESHDAAADIVVGDGPVNCPFAPCAAMQLCCRDPNQPQNPVYCVAAGGTCNGTTGACGSDQDCLFGSGMHCCASVDTLSAQCQTGCSGHTDVDQTLRLCASNAECPADLPTCSSLGIGGQMLYACTAGS